MRTFDQAAAAARDSAPFSNGDEGEMWMGANCGNCIHDKGTRTGSDESGCPLVMVALLGQTPAEWLSQPEGRYVCVEFVIDEPRPRTPREPRPVPALPGQLELFPVDTLTNAGGVS